MADTLEQAWQAFDRRAEELGHRLRRDEDGNVDHWVCDGDIHNGPGCEVCHASWCHHCSGPDDIKPCDGGKAHEDYERRRLAELKAKYEPELPA